MFQKSAFECDRVVVFLSLDFSVVMNFYLLRFFHLIEWSSQGLCGSVVLTLGCSLSHRAS